MNTSMRMNIMAAILAASSLTAGTLTWDKDPTTGGIQDGAGTWDGTTNTWWNGTANTLWSDASDVVFGNGGAGGTITISGIPPTVNSITFNTITAQYTLSSGTINLANAQTQLGGAASPTIGSVLAGTGKGIVKWGTGRVTLTGSNTYTGATSIQGGGATPYFYLSGANGSVLNSSSINFSAGGVLMLDNSSNVNSDRLGDTVPVNMDGGTLQNYSLKANNNWTENTGTLNINSGANTINPTAQASVNYTSTWTFASLSRSAGATVLFSGPSIGVDTRNQIKFTSAPTLTNGIIGGWALHLSSGVYNWATYDATYGVQALATYQTGVETAWSSADNVKVTTTPSLTDNRTINSLFLSNNGTANAGMTLNSKTLTILSGGILAYGVVNSNPYTGANDATRGTITSGTSGPSELVITKAGGNWWMNIGATLTDNAGGGAVSLVAYNNSSSYAIMLYSAANSYSGDTIVNSGYLLTGSTISEVIPNGVGKGNVIVNTGGLLGLNNETINGLSGVGTVSLGTDKTVKVGDNNATSAFSGTITGAGALQKIGAGTLTLTGTNNTYSGGTTISNGVLAIAKTNLLGTGTIALSGGTLSNTVAMTSGLGLANTINLTSVGTLDTSAGNLLLTGAITNNGSMIKAGANGLLIYGAKTGTGALTVSAGYLGGTNVWAGTVTNLAMITAADTNTIGSLTVSNLVLAADSTLLWNYDNTNYDVIHVAGTLTLPAVATVQVSRVSGKLPPLATLATYNSLAGSSNLQNWKVVGDSVQPRTYVRINNNEVQLVSPTGTLISIF